MLDWVWDKEIDMSLYLVWLGQWGHLEIGVFKQILSGGLLKQQIVLEANASVERREVTDPVQKVKHRTRERSFRGPRTGSVEVHLRNRGDWGWMQTLRGACWSQGLKGSVWAWKSLEQGRAFRAKKPLVVCCDPVGDHLLGPLWPTVASNQEVHSDLHSQSPPYRHTHQHS